MEKVKVLYIAGMTRSGSTILGRLLGELPDAVHIGEVAHFARPYFEEQTRCECRVVPGECEFWEAVFERAFGGLKSLDLTALEKTRQEYRLRTLPRLLLPRTPDQSRRLQEMLVTFGALYAAIRDVSGAKVVVDGSKDPLYGYLLRRAAGIDLKMVHLVRDSRAVAFSHQRVKKKPASFAGSGQLEQFSPGRSALDWTAVTLFLSVLRAPRPVLLRYEDFVANPLETIRALWELTGETMPCLEFLREPVLHLHPGHMIEGNPDRFNSEVRIKPDFEWRRKLPAAHHRLVTILTYPLLLSLGYLDPSPSPTDDAPIQPSPVLQ